MYDCVMNIIFEEEWDQLIVKNLMVVVTKNVVLMLLFSYVFFAVISNKSSTQNVGFRAYLNKGL